MIEVEELVQELFAVEIQLESMGRVGNEVFVEGPLTGTREEQIKKMEVAKKKK